MARATACALQGNLEPRQIHDATLEPFIKDRLGQGSSATTINGTLKVVRTILNRAARSYRDDDGRPWLDAIPPLISMLPEDLRLNNSGWRQARREAGLPLVRVHDLRHSFGARLRAAGVSAEDREALLGHANHSMAGHYASADVGRLLAQANLIVDRSGTQTLLRIAEHQCGRVESSHSVPQQRKENLVLHTKSFNRIIAARTGG